MVASVFFFVRRRDKWPLGVARSLSSGRWGGLRPPPVAGSIFFSFFFGSLEKLPEMAVGVASVSRR
jgi:hypothetical protein